MTIHLKDYQKSEVFYQYDFITGIVSQELTHPDSTSGYCSFKKIDLLSAKRTFVAIFIKDQSVFVIIESQKYEIYHNGKIRFSIKERFGISICRIFSIYENEILINEIHYTSFSSSKEEWPDDYSDIFQFIVNTLSKGFESALLRRELVETEGQ